MTPRPTRCKMPSRREMTTRLHKLQTDPVIRSHFISRICSRSCSRSFTAGELADFLLKEYNFWLGTRYAAQVMLSYSDLVSMAIVLTYDGEYNKRVAQIIYRAREDRLQSTLRS